MTKEHTSLEKYTSYSFFSKGLRKGYVGEVIWRRNRLQHIDPKFLRLWKHFFLILLGCSTESHWGPQALCVELVPIALNCNSNSNCNWLLLTRTVYNCLTSSCFLWVSHVNRIQPIHKSLISSTGWWYLWYLRLDAPDSWLTAGSRVNVLDLSIYLSIKKMERKILIMYEKKCISKYQFRSTTRYLRYEIRIISGRKGFRSSSRWELWIWKGGLNEYRKIFDKYSKRHET